MSNRILSILAIATTVALTALPATAAGEGETLRARVLITNDNGIDDPKIVALARAFAQRAETWVVAPDRDRSGSGSYLSVTGTGSLSVERRELGDGIEAFAVSGFPADCVLLALTGILADDLPDLVVSGINGGPNLGAGWMFSGTVGAARVAALAGIPSLAVSGLDDDLPGAVESAVDWVVRLAESDAVRSLRPGEYLTASLPRTSPSDILGVRVADRAPPLEAPRLAADESGATWHIVGMSETGFSVPEDSDQAAYDAGYIAVVPMRVDEVDVESLSRWRRLGADLPDWAPDAAASRP